MANDTIDSDLYQEALKQILSRIEREAAPVSALARDTVTAMWKESAAERFANSWYAAKQMQIEQNRHVARRKPVEKMPERTLPADLSPSLRATIEASRKKRAAMFESSNTEMYAAVDAHHDKVILGLFTRLGINTSTAEKVVTALKSAVSR